MFLNSNSLFPSSNSYDATFMQHSSMCAIHVIIIIIVPVLRLHLSNELPQSRMHLCTSSVIKFCYKSSVIKFCFWQFFKHYDVPLVTDLVSTFVPLKYNNHSIEKDWSVTDHIVWISWLVHLKKMVQIYYFWHCFVSIAVIIAYELSLSDTWAK